MAVPKIRFPGFTEDWEQRKFEDVFEEYSEKNHEELPPLTIIQGQGTIRRDESDRALQYDKSSLHNYKMVNVGDFILHLRSFEGGLEVAKQQGIISPAYHTFHGKESDSRFYYPFFRSYQFINVLLKPHVFGIRDGKSIDVEGMKKIEIPYPSYEEQKQLGDFFDQLDKTITLHQRKLESMKLLKKSLLQKMLPKSGETVPEVRFPGFTDAWEQRKLSGMATFSKGSGYSKADLKTSGKPIILYGRMYTKYETIIRNVDTFAEEKAGSVYSESGDVIVPASGETAQDISRASVVANSGILLGGDINIIHPNNELNPGFLALTISNGNQQKKLSMKAQGATIVHLHNEDLKGVDILCPSIDEQTLISEFFERIDNTITLHQRKVEILHKLKKSLLQQMFV